jgi:hypothetical protein
MKKIFKFIALLSIIIVFSTGCKQSSSSESSSTSTAFTNPFFPMDVGDFWVYKELGSTHDSVKRNEIIGTSVIQGNTYFNIKEIWYGKPASWNDTVLFRFIDSGMLVKYIGGIDSPYINFSPPIVWVQSGEKYPGLLNAYPFSDSISIGRFDSLKYIIFRGLEPSWAEFAKNIGGIEWDYPATMTLIRAKVGGKNYP